MIIPCPECGGTVVQDGLPCPDCNATGEIEVSQWDREYERRCHYADRERDSE